MTGKPSKIGEIAFRVQIKARIIMRGSFSLIRPSGFVGGHVRMCTPSHCAFEDVLPEKIQTMVLHGQFH